MAEHLETLSLAEAGTTLGQVLLEPAEPWSPVRRSAIHVALRRPETMKMGSEPSLIH
jgi:hypothetical protein